jgi:hypothetical protein
MDERIKRRRKKLRKYIIFPKFVFINSSFLGGVENPIRPSRDHLINWDLLAHRRTVFEITNNSVKRQISKGITFKGSIRAFS